MVEQIMISKTSDGWFRTIVGEKYSTPWHYGETPEQALKSAPKEIKAHTELIGTLITRPGAVDVVINNYETRVNVYYIYGKYRHIVPKSAPSLEAALEELLRDVEKMNV